jgi:hypothetical protein
MNSEVEKTINGIKEFHWKHRNLILLMMSIILAYYILKFKPILYILYGLEHLGYLAALIAGMMFTYGLTAVPATAILFNLGKILNPLLIAIIGACGSVMGDYLIFRFVRDRLMDEIKLLTEEIDQLTKPVTSMVFTDELRILIWKGISRSKIWKTLIPIIAGLIIASPLPDEFGAALFGAVNYEPKKFVVYSYFLNFMGILVLTVLAKTSL